MNPTDLVPTNNNEPTPEQRKLTVKQRRWIKHYAKTGNATEAARLAGYECENEDSFKVIGFENLTKLNFGDLLEEMGLTDQLLGRLIFNGALSATKKIPKKTVVKKRFDKETNREIVIMEYEYEDVPDNTTREKYIKTAAQLKKRLGSGSEDKENKNPLNVGEMNVQIINYGDGGQEIKTDGAENN